MKFSTFVHCATIICLSVGLGACKDETDKKPPLVNITRPYENQIFQSVDTLEVEATITDNEQIEWVVLEILDQEFHTLSISKSLTLSGSEVNLATEFIIDAPELDTGPYYLAVRAGDGTNIGSAFVAIGISAIPRVVQGYYAVTQSTGQTRIWYRSVSQDDFQIVHHQFSDFGGAALNYRRNYIGLAGRTSGDAVFYNTDDWSPRLVIPGIAGGLPYFTGMKYAPATDRFFLWRYDGFLTAFDSHLQQLNAFYTLPTRTPIDVFDLGDRYFVVEKQISGSNHSLASYTETGLLATNLSIDGPARLVANKSSDELFVWIDAPDEVQLKILNRQSSLLESPYSRPGAALYDAITMDPGVFAILTSDGLLTFNYNTGGTTVISPSSNHPGSVVYEDITGQFFVLDATEVLRLSPTGSPIENIAFPDPVVYFAVDYTR